MTKVAATLQGTLSKNGPQSELFYSTSLFVILSEVSSTEKNNFRVGYRSGMRVALAVQRVKQSCKEVLRYWEARNRSFVFCHTYFVPEDYVSFRFLKVVKTFS